MTSRSKEEVQSLLTPYLATFVAVLTGAWREWSETEYPGRWRFNRTRANFIWEAIAERATAAFEGDPRIHIRRRNESLLFVLDGSLAFRFKKSDQSGLTSNVPTQAVLAFHDPERELPGMPSVDRVDVVYVLNKLQTAITDVLIVARENENVSWTFSAIERDNVVPMPLPSEPQELQEESPAKKVVRVKSEAARDEHSEVK